MKDYFEADGLSMLLKMASFDILIGHHRKS